MSVKWSNIDINGIHEYRISTNGDIIASSRNVYYVDGRIRYYYEQVIKPRKDGKGYYFVTLHGHGIKPVQIRVHQLVARAFIPNPENKPCINHKNGNRLDNRVSNLEWCTYKENTQDGINRGSINKPGKKLTRTQVHLIRKEYRSGPLFQREIAEKYGVKQTQISRIVNFKNWE